MPGLIGFVKENLPDAEAFQFIESMARSLDSDPGYRVDLYHTDGIGLGRVGIGTMNPRPQPVWSDDGTLGIVMEGELYDSAPLRRELEDLGDPVSSAGDAELVLRLYRHFGESFLPRLNGAFVFAIWDRHARKLTVANDRLGLFPLYFANTNHDFIFGSGIRALLADRALSRKIDLLAINELLVFEHALDDRTFLEEVRLLPQATLLTFQDGRTTLRPYWTLRYPETYRYRTEEEYLEGLLYHLRQAVKRQQPGEHTSGILLSGGLDSRILLALFHELLGADGFQTFTFGIPGCDDARYAREMSRKLNIRHHFNELKSDWLIQLAERAVQLTDGLGVVSNLHALATLEEEARHAEVLYKGFMGDAMMGFSTERHMWADYPQEDLYDIQLGFYKKRGYFPFHPPEWDRIYSAGFRKKVGNALRDTYRAALNRSNVRQLANQRMHFDLAQRVPRMTIHGVEVARSRCIVRLPFAENDLLDYVLTIPPGFLFDRYLPRLVLQQYYPRLAKTPITPAGMPMISCARDLILQARKFASWHLNKVGLARLVEWTPQSYQGYNTWFRGALRPWVEEILLGSRSLERGYFEPEIVKELVGSHMSGENHATRLAILLTIELWHRQFID